MAVGYRDTRKGKLAKQAIRLIGRQRKLDKKLDAAIVRAKKQLSDLSRMTYQAKRLGKKSPKK